MSTTKVITTTKSGVDGTFDLRVLDIAGQTCSNPLRVEGMGEETSLMGNPGPFVFGTRRFTHSGDTLYMAKNDVIATFDTTTNPPRLIKQDYIGMQLRIRGIWCWGPYMVVKLQETSYHDLWLYDRTTMARLGPLTMEVTVPVLQTISANFVGPVKLHIDAADDLVVIPRVNWTRDRHWWICAQVRSTVLTIMLMVKHCRSSVWGVLSKDVVVGRILPLLFQESMLAIFIQYAAKTYSFIWELPPLSRFCQ